MCMQQPGIQHPRARCNLEDRGAVTLTSITPLGTESCKGEKPLQALKGMCEPKHGGIPRVCFPACCNWCMRTCVLSVPAKSQLFW